MNDATLLRQGLLTRINGTYRMEAMYEAQDLKFDAVWWNLERIKLRCQLLALIDENPEIVGSPKPAF